MDWLLNARAIKRVRKDCSGSGSTGSYFNRSAVWSVVKIRSIRIRALLRLTLTCWSSTALLASSMSWPKDGAVLLAHQWGGVAQQVVFYPQSLVLLIWLSQWYSGLSSKPLPQSTEQMGSRRPSRKRPLWAHMLRAGLGADGAGCTPTHPLGRKVQVLLRPHVSPCVSKAINLNQSRQPQPQPHPELHLLRLLLQ